MFQHGRDIGTVIVISVLGLCVNSFAGETEVKNDIAQRQMEALHLSKRQRAKMKASVKAREIESAARSIEPVNTIIESPRQSWNHLGLTFEKAKNQGDSFVQKLSNGSEVTYTIDPELQRHLEATLDKYEVPHGSVVLIEPETGAVRAMVSESRQKPPMEQLATKATAPAASVFKIITATALLKETDLNPNRTICYSGGISHLSKQQITTPLDQGVNCADLGEALANSINSIFGKLAYRFLSREELAKWARKYRFNRSIPFNFGLEKSKANISADRIERSKTAAGFWDTYMSPLHGTLISAAIVNDGVMMKPRLVDEIKNSNGRTIYQSEPEKLTRVVDKKTASTLRSLLEGTATDGTADRYFAHRPGFPHTIDVGGKTGTLANDHPYLSFSWFVGFGKRNGHSVAVSSLVCNKPEWRIKGPYVASEGLNHYF